MLLAANEKTKKSTPNRFFFPRVYQNLARGFKHRFFSTEVNDPSTLFAT